MIKEIVLRPAYGKTPKSSTDLISMWESGKDFAIMPNGPYCSIRNVEALKTMAGFIVLQYIGKTDIFTACVYSSTR